MDACPALSPVEVVQRQLDAYNAHHLEALLSTYSEEAQLFEHPATLVAAGTAQIRERFAARLKEKNLHAQLLRRIAMGSVVIDHERVTRTFPGGFGSLELIATCEVAEGKIVKATFLAGPRRLDSPAEAGEGNELVIRGFAPGDETAVIDLWHRCGLLAPQNKSANGYRAEAQRGAGAFSRGNTWE